MSFVRPMLTSTSPFALQMPDAGGTGAPAVPPAAAPPAAAPAPAAPVTPAAADPAWPGAPTPPAAPASPGTLAAPPPTPAPAAPPPAPPAAAGTLAQTGETPPVAVPANFPDNWRETMAGNDTAYLETLKRFDSPTALAKAYKELRTQRDSGQLKAAPQPLPENATPEQITAWRRDQGLPETSDAYLSALALPGGVVPGEHDKPLLASFAEHALAAGWKPEQYNQAVSWYYDVQDKLMAERQQADDDNYLETRTELLREWGPNFSAKQNNFNNWLAKTFPQELQGAVLNARLPDGTKMFGHAGVLKAVMEQWETINPIGAVLPNVPGATLANADARIGEIETKYMRAVQGTPEWKQYWTNPAMQEELRNLYTARETMKARQTAA